MQSARWLCREGPWSKGTDPPEPGRGPGASWETPVGPTCPHGSWRPEQDQMCLCHKPLSGAVPGPAGPPDPAGADPPGPTPGAARAEPDTPTSSLKMQQGPAAPHPPEPS